MKSPWHPTAPTGDRYLVEVYGVAEDGFGPIPLPSVRGDQEIIFDSAEDAAAAILEESGEWEPVNGAYLTDIFVTKFNSAENISRDVTEDIEQLVFQQWRAVFSDFEAMPDLLQSFRCVVDDDGYSEWAARQRVGDQ